MNLEKHQAYIERQRILRREWMRRKRAEERARRIALLNLTGYVIIEESTEIIIRIPFEGYWMDIE